MFIHGILQNLSAPLEMITSGSFMAYGATFLERRGSSELQVFSEFLSTELLIICKGQCQPARQLDVLPDGPAANALQRLSYHSHASKLKPCECGSEIKNSQKIGEI